MVFLVIVSSAREHFWKCHHKLVQMCYISKIKMKINTNSNWVKLEDHQHANECQSRQVCARFFIGQGLTPKSREIYNINKHEKGSSLYTTSTCDFPYYENEIVIHCNSSSSVPSVFPPEQSKNKNKSQSIFMLQHVRRKSLTVIPCSHLSTYPGSMIKKQILYPTQILPQFCTFFTLVLKPDSTCNTLDHSQKPIAFPLSNDHRLALCSMRLHKRQEHLLGGFKRHFSSCSQNTIKNQSPFCSWRLNSLPELLQCHPDMGVIKRHCGVYMGEYTIEKRLRRLIDKSEMDEAVKLLRSSVAEGVVPELGVMTNLQKKLAQTGEVEAMLDLHLFLKEHQVTSDVNFFYNLREAYQDNNKISEGVLTLRLLYHRSKKFADVEIFFTLLCVMVLRDFPQRMNLIMSFVKDLKEAEDPVPEVEAALWKCYILTKRWKAAEHLVLNNMKLLLYLPAQVERICLATDRVPFEQAAVLGYLLRLPFLKHKLQVLVAHCLMDHLVADKQWERLLEELEEMKKQGVTPHPDKLTPTLNNLQFNMPAQQDPPIEELRHWCDTLYTRDPKERR